MLSEVIHFSWTLKKQLHPIYRNMGHNNKDKQGLLVSKTGEDLSIKNSMKNLDPFEVLAIRIVGDQRWDSGPVGGLGSSYLSHSDIRVFMQGLEKRWQCRSISLLPTHTHTRQREKKKKRLSRFMTKTLAEMNTTVLVVCACSE